MHKIIAVVALLFAMCAPTYVVKKIDKKDLETLSVALLPFYNCTIYYQGSVEKLFGKGDKDSLIINYLQETIATKMVGASCFKSIELCECQSTCNVEKESITEKDGVVEILKPIGEIKCRILFCLSVIVSSIHQPSINGLEMLLPVQPR
jgi:hypothetical protein